MREDRLRALRAIRFAARFGFTIDAATRTAIEVSAPFLGRLSRERVKQELDKTMEQVRCPSAALETWRSTGAFRSLVPALDACPPDGIETPDYLAMPGPHTRPARRGIRFAGLMLGLDARVAAAALTDLRASRAEIQLVSTLLERWAAVKESLSAALVSPEAPSDAQVRAWVASIGRLQVGHLMRLASGVWAGARARGEVAPSQVAVRALYRRMLVTALRDPIDLGALAVDGDDLRRAGIPPGPALGRILQALLASVIVDPTRNTTDWLLQEAQRLEAESPRNAGHTDRR
jgi:tRNA nucleotidyltransferase (CCA-adding enzyme)